MNKQILSIISDEIDNDPKKAFPIIAENGYRYVELHNINDKTIEELNSDEIDELKKLLKENKLKVSNLASTIFFLCPLKPDYHVSLFNQAFHCIEGNVPVHLEYLKNACKIANELSCKTIRIFPFRYPDNEEYKIVGNDDDIMMISIYVKQACGIAAKYGITLLLENCPYSHCPKGEMTNKILSLCDCDNLKLLWDPANSYRAEKSQVPAQYLNKDLFQEKNLIIDHIGHVHIKNYHYDGSQLKPFVHVPLLKGDIDFKRILNGLEVPLSLEPETDQNDAIYSMECLRSLV